ncbi:hypothetical protein ACWFMI_07325 [Nocardiopsis terrae]
MFRRFAGSGLAAGPHLLLTGHRQHELRRIPCRGAQGCGLATDVLPLDR